MDAPAVLLPAYTQGDGAHADIKRCEAEGGDGRNGIEGSPEQQSPGHDSSLEPPEFKPCLHLCWPLRFLLDFRLSKPQDDELVLFSATKSVIIYYCSNIRESRIVSNSLF